MRRKRSQVDMSIASLMKTICSHGTASAGLPEANDISDAQSFCGRMQVACADDVHRGFQNVFVNHWIELRGDVIIFSDAASKAVQPLKATRVSFAVVVESPHSSFLTTPEMKLVASKLAHKPHLIVYGVGEQANVWIEFDDAKEAEAWRKVRKNDGDAPHTLTLTLTERFLLPRRRRPLKTPSSREIGHQHGALACKRTKSSNPSCGAKLSSKEKCSSSSSSKYPTSGWG
jgi:hypothetical protein